MTSSPLQLVTRIYPHLITSTAVPTAAFAAGFFWGPEQPSDFIRYPLSSALAGCLSGVLYGIGGEVVNHFLPRVLRAPLVICIGASCVYTLVRRKSFPRRSRVVVVEALQSDSSN
jgi:hypothetical protein